MENSRQEQLWKIQNLFQRMHELIYSNRHRDDIHIFYGHYSINGIDCII